jgi:hypothetical protein
LEEGGSVSPLIEYFSEYKTDKLVPGSAKRRIYKKTLKYSEEIREELEYGLFQEKV